MKPYVPVIKKVAESESVLVERALPTEGIIRTQTGSEVKPFDHIGECTVSHNLLVLPVKFKPKDPKTSDKFYYSGSVIGKAYSKQVTAPYNGYLFKDDKDNLYKFKQIESRHTLLAGVWGTIEKIKEKKSVLIKTTVLDLSLVATTKTTFSGEFVVFPNPSDNLKKHYLSGFSSGGGGRIVYVGDHATLELVAEAYKLGVGCLLAGSATKETVNFAKKKNMGLGLLSGFGDISTPKETYDLLNEVGNRFVFFQGERNLLRIPVSPGELKKTKSRKRRKKSVLKSLRKNVKVVVLEKPYFGHIGKVDSVSDYSIFVKFPDKPDIKEPVEVKLPNVLAIE